MEKLSENQIKLLIQVSMNNSEVKTTILETELNQLIKERYLVNIKETPKGLDCNLSIKGQEVVEKYK